MNWDQFFEWLMDRERRVIHHDRRDPGGQTAWGISRRHHPFARVWELVDRGVTSGVDFEGHVKDFYREEYGTLWDSAPVRVRPVLVDTAVNMGQEYAVRCMQTALCKLAGSAYITVDGDWGPKTDFAVKKANHDGLAMAMCAVRMAEYNRRATVDKSKKVFLQGWLNRVSLLMDVL